jgi:hypothetical protein
MRAGHSASSIRVHGLTLAGACRALVWGPTSFYIHRSHLIGGLIGSSGAEIAKGLRLVHLRRQSAYGDHDAYDNHD